MRLTGTLRTWHDDRGFGFIAPAQGGKELFVHISAFPKDGSRPTVGETLWYEPGQGRDGKPQALRVVRQAVGVQQPVSRRSVAKASGRRTGISGVFASLAMLVVLVSLGAYGYRQFQAHAHRAELASMPAQPQPAPQAQQAPVVRQEPSSLFTCDGRTRCTQMTSCQEAKYFINHCPGTQMDGDHDGVPCEDHWCSGG